MRNFAAWPRRSSFASPTGGSPADLRGSGSARGLSECASKPPCGPSRERLADGRENCRHECGLKGASSQAPRHPLKLSVS